MRTAAVVLLVIVALGGAALWWISGRGYSARATPSALEAEIAERVRGLAIPRGAKDKTNPVRITADSVHMGLEHFADHCAICHGNDGRGQTTIGQGLYPKPPDLTDADAQGLTDGELYYIIVNGIRFTGMPGFGEDQPEETWHVVNFMRHLPKITPAELQHMEALNPKSPADRDEEQKEEEFLKGGKRH
jgi:mono/diheme cytochrome c family protein